MNCYDCQPLATPAVALCQVCGKGVCGRHCLRQERPVYERVPGGMAAQVRHSGRRALRMVCAECDRALGTGDHNGTVEVHRRT